MIETIITAILAFASTNVDDLFILMILFTLTSDTFQNKNILTGQYLGIITLVVISLIGSLIGIIIPTVYIGFLGFFPIYLGIMKLITFFKRKDENEQEEVLEIPQRNKSILSSIVGASTLSVASITIANGADNIGIYIPLFVNLSVIDLVITIGIFMLLVFIWVKAAEYLVRHPALKETLAKYNHILFPIILIGLGIYILVESKSYSLVL
jgi:cadmium resistance transport/sequestration family protein